VYYDDNPSLIVIALDHLYRVGYLLFDRDLRRPYQHEAGAKTPRSVPSGVRYCLIPDQYVTRSRRIVQFQVQVFSSLREIAIDLLHCHESLCAQEKRRAE